MVIWPGGDFSSPSACGLGRGFLTGSSRFERAKKTTLRFRKVVFTRCQSRGGFDHVPMRSANDGQGGADTGLVGHQRQGTVLDVAFFVKGNVAGHAFIVRSFQRWQVLGRVG